MGGGQGGCERRIEVFVKIQKKNWGGGGRGEGWVGGGGVRVDVIEELKFLGKFTKKKIGGGGGRVGGGLGGRGRVGGQGGCDRRIEVLEKIHKKKFGGGGVGSGGGGGGVGGRGRVGGVWVDVNKELKFL